MLPQAKAVFCVIPTSIVESDIIMDDRIIQFIDALRAAGVRISVAESADALRAIEATGIAEKDVFRAAMQATLVKEAHDIPEFERLFPSFFGSGPPPMPNQPG